MHIICVGEGMLELRGVSKQYTASFSGDVINFCVYLKRSSPTASVALFSAIGKDHLSDDMLEFLEDEGISSDLIARSDDKTLGLYTIHTDDQGERNFNYWRSDSAARQMFSLIDLSILSKAATTADYFYFSGITLAILKQADREKLLSFATDLREAGKTIVFDPNYRARLWDNNSEAQTQIGKAYSVANIVLSSYDDEQDLFGITERASIEEHLQLFNIDEVILTNGPQSIAGMHEGKWFEVEPQKPARVIDTTSAGDSFNAAYLSVRHAGLPPIEAIKQASSLAAVVIGLPGAIIPKSEMPKIH